MRNDLYAQLQRLDVGFHDRWQSGQLLSRAMTDLSVIRRFVGFGAIFFILIVVQVLAIFGVLLALHPSARSGRVRRHDPGPRALPPVRARYMAVVRRIQDQTGDLTTTIEEGAKGIRVIKAFGRGDVAFAGYQAEAQTIHDTQIERITLHTRFVWVLALIPNLTLAPRPARGRAGGGLGRPHPRRPRRLRLLRPDARVPARDAGLDHGAGRGGRERRGPDLRGVRHRADHRGPSRRGRARRRRARRHPLRGRVVHLRGQRPHRAAAASTSPWRPGETSRSSAPPARARRPSPRCSRGCTTRPSGGSRSTGTTSAT